MALAPIPHPPVTGSMGQPLPDASSWHHQWAVGEPTCSNPVLVPSGGPHVRAQTSPPVSKWVVKVKRQGGYEALSHLSQARWVIWARASPRKTLRFSWPWRGSCAPPGNSSGHRHCVRMSEQVVLAGHVLVKHLLCPRPFARPGDMTVLDLGLEF